MTLNGFSKDVCVFDVITSSYAEPRKTRYLRMQARAHSPGGSARRLAKKYRAKKCSLRNWNSRAQLWGDHISLWTIGWGVSPGLGKLVWVHFLAALARVAYGISKVSRCSETPKFWKNEESEPTLWIRGQTTTIFLFSLEIHRGQMNSYVWSETSIEDRDRSGLVGWTTGVNWAEYAI